MSTLVCTFSKYLLYYIRYLVGLQVHLLQTQIYCCKTKDAVYWKCSDVSSFLLCHPEDGDSTGRRNVRTVSSTMRLNPKSRSYCITHRPRKPEDENNCSRILWLENDFFCINVIICFRLLIFCGMFWFLYEVVQINEHIPIKYIVLDHINFLEFIHTMNILMETNRIYP
jgi:hypothetical protein